MQREPQFFQTATDTPHEPSPMSDFLSLLVVTVSLSGLGIISLVSLAQTLGWLV